MSDTGCVSKRRIYSGRVINLDIDTVRFPNGSIGELEMIRHSGASAIVPFLSDPNGANPEILLIRQYRYAAEQFLYEIPAGRIDAGESPEMCARRELMEETGCHANKLSPLFTLLTTPGFTDERIHLFMASDLEMGQTFHERDEFISLERCFLSDALGMLERGEISDAKTALALLYAARFRLSI